MSEEAIVSIIIPNFNGRSLLQDCLDSVFEQTYGSIQVILVDNGSTDDSVVFVKQRYPKITIIANVTNVGFAKAVNIGIDSSRGEYIALLNSDTRADKDWIMQLTQAMKNDKRVGSCASKQLIYFNPGVFDAAGLILHRGGYAASRGHNQHDSGQFQKKEYIFGCHGASAFYRRKMLEEIGLFDEDYFVYNEEFDIALRAQLAGWKCEYVPDAVIYHMSGQTRAGKDKRFLIYYMERNRIFTIIKNYPVSMLLYCLPFLLKYELDILMRFVGGFEIEPIIARIDALWLLPRMFAKRGLIQGKRTVSARSLRKFLNSENR